MNQKHQTGLVLALLLATLPEEQQKAFFEAFPTPPCVRCGGVPACPEPPTGIVLCYDCAVKENP